MSFAGRVFFVGSLMVTGSIVLLVNYYLHREKQLLFLKLKFLLTKQNNLEETRQSFEGSFSSATRTRISNNIENEWELTKNSLSNANKSFIFWRTNSISGKFWKKLNNELVLLQRTSSKVPINEFDLDLCSFWSDWVRTERFDSLDRFPWRNCSRANPANWPFYLLCESMQMRNDERRRSQNDFVWFRAAEVEFLFRWLITPFYRISNDIVLW